MKPVKVIEFGQVTGSLYEKADGTFTTWSKNDVMAVNVAFVLAGAVLLSLIA
jgi:hypothetical protein